MPAGGRNFRPKCNRGTTKDTEADRTYRALTDHPLGLNKLIPLRVHGELETHFVPALVLLPWITGASRQEAAKRDFLTFAAVAAAN